MDRLTQRDRQAFQAAAVIGQRFELALLRHLVGAPSSMIPKMSLFVAMSFFTAAMSSFVSLLRSAMSWATAAKPPSTAFRTVPSIAGLGCDFVAAIRWAV
jgi:hypothetical protein